MKCADATAGIASVVTGLAVVLSGAPAHATFIYLNQSQLVAAAIGVGSAASSSGKSSATDPDLRYGDEHIALVAEKAEGANNAEHADTELVYAGLLQPSAGVYDSDARSGDRASYSAPSSDFRWMSPLSAVRVDNALPRYRADSNLTRQPSVGSPAPTPAKDAPAGTGGVTAPVATPPASIPTETGAPPVQSTPISTPPKVETPIVGVPSKSVPEPSTVGLLGIGLLLVFLGVGRTRRVRYYSKVSGSPRSSRQMGSLARSLNQDSLNRA